MLTSWQVVRTAPGAHQHPAELDRYWAEGTAVRADQLVSAAMPCGDPDAHDWWCRSGVQLSEDHRLEFSGLTFPATVFVDGEPVAECTSMFLPVRVVLAAGRHEVCLRFGSLQAWLAGARGRGRWRSGLVGTPAMRGARTTLVGRAPVYGELDPAVGMWRPVRLTPSRLAVDVTVSADPVAAVAAFSGALARPARVGVTVRDPDGVPVGEAESDCGTTFELTVPVADPKLWYPRGYGEQPLYRAEFSINGQRIAHRDCGFRTIAVDQDNGGWALRVNGVSVFCRGAVWTPPDPVALTASPDAMAAQLRWLCEAGANMIRLPGGVINEQDEFWSGCAELGLLVWQDAMLSTFDPTAEAADVIEAEARHLLAERGGNPALAVLCGGSETAQRPEMLGLTREGATIEVAETRLPRLAAGYPGGLGYVPSSPWSEPATGELAIRPDIGVAHWFGVGAYLQRVGEVRSAGVRFATECLAFAIPPAPQSVERHFGGPAVAGHHPAWKAGVPRDRGASWDFEDVRDHYVREIFGVDPLSVRRSDPARYLQLGRCAVAEAMRACYAFWRQPDSGCAGALVLSARDFVPGAGWGLLDVDGLPKGPMWALARVWAPVALVLSDVGLAGLRVDIHNDTPEQVSGTLWLRAVDARAMTVLDVQREVTVPPHGTVTLSDSALTGRFQDLTHAFGFGVPVADAVDARFCLGSGQQLCDVLVVRPRPEQISSGLAAAARLREDGRWVVEVRSEVTLRHVELEVPGWTPSDNFFHLAPGIAHTVELCGGAGVPRGVVSSVDAVGTAGIEVPT